MPVPIAMPRVGTSGHCPQFERLARRSGGWRVVRFPAAWLLVEHPVHGPVLVDSGYGPAAWALRRTVLGTLYYAAAPIRWGPERSTARQLASAGVVPGAVQHVVLTHWHADHAGALSELPDALVHTDAPGLEHLRRLPALRAATHGFFGAIADQVPERRLQALPAWAPAPAWLAPFVEAADVFGDGSLWVVPLPGHAVGQVGVAGRDAHGTVWLWAADAAWRRDAWLAGDLPPDRVLGTACADVRAYRASLACVAAFAARAGTRVAVAHDPASWDGWGRL